MANIVKRPEINIVKKVHRFTHCNDKELQKLFEKAGMLTPKIKNAIKKVTTACNPCAWSGRPSKTRKISLKHVNEEFNVEVQADFMTAKFGQQNYEILNVIDTGTAYCECIVVESRNTKTMIAKFEEIWFCRHGAPSYFSADPEFCQPFPTKYLAGHGVKTMDKQARESNKNGRVERSNGVFKSIFEKMEKENIRPDIIVTAAQTSMASNIIYGRSKLNSMQLARGYLPGIAGLPPKIFKQEVLDKYTQNSVYHAINKEIKSKDPHNIPSSSINPVVEIFVFHKRTNKAVDVVWILAKVEAVKEHYMECRRSKKDNSMCVAYEHISLVPRNE